MVSVDIQISSSHTSWPVIREASLKAEELGFDTLWTFDHLAGVALGGHTNLECFTWLGALAEATTTIELGVLVANVWNRQVGTLVVGAASVSEISGRRFHLGIGAGASPTSPWAAEQRAVDADLADELVLRHRRVEAVLDLSDQMWSQQRPDHLSTFPQPGGTPHRIVGVNSVALSEIAGRRAEGVNVAWDNPRRHEFLEAARLAASGRDFITTAWVRWTPELLDPTHPTRLAMDAEGLDRIILAVIDDCQVFLDGW